MQTQVQVRNWNPSFNICLHGPTTDFIRLAGSRLTHSRTRSRLISPDHLQRVQDIFLVTRLANHASLMRP